MENITGFLDATEIPFYSSIAPSIPSVLRHGWLGSLIDPLHQPLLLHDGHCLHMVELGASLGSWLQDLLCCYEDLLSLGMDSLWYNPVQAKSSSSFLLSWYWMARQSTITSTSTLRSALRNSSLQILATSLCFSEENVAAKSMENITGFLDATEIPFYSSIAPSIPSVLRHGW